MQDNVQREQWKDAHNARVTGLQAYHLDVPGAAHSKNISVVSIWLTEVQEGNKWMTSRQS